MQIFNNPCVGEGGRGVVIVFYTKEYVVRLTLFFLNVFSEIKLFSFFNR